MFDDPPNRASILDRLRVNGNCDHAAGRQQLHELIDSVHDHLEILLNTRWWFCDIDDDNSELDRSLLTYGIPDFGSLAIATDDGRRNLSRAMERAIRAHEPRFMDVKVEVLEADEAGRKLHFKIAGELHATPEPELVAFDSMIDSTDQKIRVKSSDNV